MQIRLFFAIRIVALCREGVKVRFAAARNGMLAVILSAQEYDRLRALNVAELERLCDRIAKKAAARDSAVTPAKHIQLHTTALHEG
jgi:hypothetical protein